MDSVGSGTRELRVGEWWVRPLQNEVDNGEQRTHLEARSIEVLLCLARSAPSVVPKETILDEVWGDVAVGDEVVSHAIWELRKAFGDDGRRQKVIRTIPKKGYALVAEVFWSVEGVEPKVGTPVGPYRLEEEIGRGAMGVVYRAVDTRLDRVVAVKFLAAELTRDAEAVRRFEREARLAASLDHPNLAPVFEVGEMSGGRQFLVTAYCAGGTLRDRLKEGVLPPREALGVVAQIARGLAVAHRKDVIHRDVKPANILFTDDGTARLVDFGIAKLASSTSFTRTGHSLGTPAYKSPEQSRGQPTDHRTDIWSLGIVLFECLTAQRPFSGSYEHAVVRSILEDEPDLARSLPDDASLPGLEAILRRMLSKDPAERYPSADDLVNDLEACLASRALPEPRPRSRWHVPIAVGAAAVCLAATAFLGVRYLSRPGPKSPEPQVSMLKRAEAETLLNDGWRQMMREGGYRQNYLEARRRFARAHSLDPGNPRVVGSLAYSHSFRLHDAEHENAEDLREASRLVEDAMGRGQEHGLFWVVKARLALIEEWQELSARDASDLLPPEERYRLAIDLARQAHDAFAPEDPEADLAKITWARALELAGRDDEAIRLYGEAAAVGTGYVRANLRLSKAYEQRDDWSRAATALESILEIREDFFPALNELGVMHLRNGLYDQALTWFQRAADVQLNADLANNLGTVYFYLDNLELATEYFQAAIELEAGHKHAHLGLGDCHREKGDLEAARAEWSVALALYARDSDRVEVRRKEQSEQAALLARLGRCDAALAIPEVTDDRFTEFTELLFLRAQVHAMCGNSAEAARAYSLAKERERPTDRFWEDPIFDSLRDDPDYRAVREGIGLLPNGLRSRVGR